MNSLGYVSEIQENPHLCVDFGTDPHNIRSSYVCRNLREWRTGDQLAVWDLSNELL